MAYCAYAPAEATQIARLMRGRADQSLPLYSARGVVTRSNEPTDQEVGGSSPSERGSCSRSTPVLKGRRSRAGGGGDSIRRRPRDRSTMARR
jgi:hypothetical protein